MEGDILTVDVEPRKANSSYGRWAVHYTISIPIGLGYTDSIRFFWRKSDALKFAQRAQKEAATHAR